MFRRLSVLGTLILASCSTQGPYLPLSTMIACSSKVPSREEAAAWRHAQRLDSHAGYRHFVHRYPKSCYAPVASARLTKAVTRKPMAEKNISYRSGSEAKSGKAY